VKPNSVLIVDDEKNIRMTLSIALAETGLGIDTAMNGEEAMEKLDRESFGLILLDLRMPGMDGLEVLRRVRRTRPDLKVIILTAHGTIDSAVEAMKLGAVDFIQKPFAPSEIRDLVRKVRERDEIRADAEGYDARVELAKKAIGERDFAAAREHARQAIAADSAKPEAFNLLGALLELEGEWLEALKQYRAALALDPRYGPARENLDRIVVDHHDGTGIRLGGEGDSGSGH
jgi:DNA-binding NtrC family response regulator